MVQETPPAEMIMFGLGVHQILFVHLTSSHLISLTSELPVIGSLIQSGCEDDLAPA